MAKFGYFDKRSENCPFYLKWENFGRKNQSTSKIPFKPIFNQNGKVLIFGLNLGKLPNYVQHFGSHNVEGVAESWVEAGGE